MTIFPTTYRNRQSRVSSREMRYHPAMIDHRTPSKAAWVVRNSSYYTPTKQNDNGEVFEDSRF